MNGIDSLLTSHKFPRSNSQILSLSITFFKNVTDSPKRCFYNLTSTLETITVAHTHTYLPAYMYKNVHTKDTSAVWEKKTGRNNEYRQQRESYRIESHKIFIHGKVIQFPDRLFADRTLVSAFSALIHASSLCPFFFLPFLFPDTYEPRGRIREPRVVYKGSARSTCVPCA